MLKHLTLRLFSYETIIMSYLKFSVIFALTMFVAAAQNIYPTQNGYSNYPTGYAEPYGYDYSNGYSNYNPYQTISNGYPHSNGYLQSTWPGAPLPYRATGEQQRLFYDNLGNRKHDHSLLENLNAFPTVSKQERQVVDTVHSNCPGGQVDGWGRCRFMY